jgi:hypothetical protein
MTAVGSAPANAEDELETYLDRLDRSRQKRALVFIAGKLTQ